MKKTQKKGNLYDEHYALLIEDLNRAKDDLEHAYASLSNVVEPDLIDCYIYEVQSVQMRYKFLLRRIKQIEDSYAKNPLEVSGS